MVVSGTPGFFNEEWYMKSPFRVTLRQEYLQHKSVLLCLKETCQGTTTIPLFFSRSYLFYQVYSLQVLGWQDSLANTHTHAQTHTHIVSPLELVVIVVFSTWRVSGMVRPARHN